MGATFVQYVTEGYDINLSFEELKRKYVQEYGNNGYTGTIASCYLGYLFKKFDGKYVKKNSTEANKIVDKARNDELTLDKGSLVCIDLGVVSYDIISVKLDKKSNKPKFELKYIIKDDNKVLYSNTNKQMAEINLCKLAIEHPNAILIKEYELVSGSSIIAIPQINIKSTKSKPKQVPNGKILKEKHKYIFFGYAPE